MNKEELIKIIYRIFNNCEEIDLHNCDEDKTGYKMLDDIFLLQNGIDNLNKENTNLKQALIDIRELASDYVMCASECRKALQIIDDVLGDEK